MYFCSINLLCIVKNLIDQIYNIGDFNTQIMLAKRRTRRIRIRETRMSSRGSAATAPLTHRALLTVRR